MTDVLDVSFVARLPDGSLLAQFNRARVLAPADVHVARRLRHLATGSEAGANDAHGAPGGPSTAEAVDLAIALAVRAPRVGHVRVDLLTVRETVAGEIGDDAEEEIDTELLAWPDPQVWLTEVAASPLVAVGEDAPPAPLRLVGSALYLDRYWRDERAVAADLLARSGADPSPRSVVSDLGSTPLVDPGVLSAGIARLFAGDQSAEQRWAAATAVLRPLSVIAGGPGTGKTTTVARVVALLAEQAEAAGSEPPLVALAAPTGKAANRMQESVRRAAADLDGLTDAVRRQLLGLEASTVHRLLRTRPDNSSRFRHNRRNRLPHDLVVLDETSMLPLWLMARLVEAVRPDARLVLVGDPEQLASVEAGAVLADIVGPAADGLRMRTAAADDLRAVTGSSPPETAAADAAALGDGVVVLRENHRFGGALADLAESIRAGHADGVVAALRAGDERVRWLPIDSTTADETALDPLRALACATGHDVLSAAQAGEARGALDALSRFRLLCAHRRGPAGASSWNARVEAWLGDELDDFSADGEWYLGRPVIVTANDYGLRLFNGDTGVVVARDVPVSTREDSGAAGMATPTRPGQPSGLSVVFDAGAFSPSRLSAIDTVYAMTVHKAQGSEFDAVAVVLPGPDSRVLTRGLLYTAVTRARRELLVVGTEETVRAAVERPVARASGLTERLWGA